MIADKRRGTDEGAQDTFKRPPFWSHLKESGEIETFSDPGAFIYRGEYYIGGKVGCCSIERCVPD